MTDRTQVNFVIAPEQKRRWEEYIDANPNADNLSHLIRLSVEQEIHSDVSDTATEESVSTDTSEVLTALQRIESQIDDLDERLGVLERRTKSEEDYDLQKAVYAVLPTPEYEDVGPDVTDMADHPKEFGVTAESVAAELGADEENVKNTLENLDDVTSQVRRAGVSGEGAFYWREE